MSRSLVRGAFDLFRGGAKETLREAAHTGAEVATKDSLHAASQATSSAIEGSSKDLLHASEDIVTSGERSEVRAASASEVEAAGKGELHPTSNPKKVPVHPSKYDGMGIRNVLIGGSKAAVTVGGGGLAGYFGYQWGKRGLRAADDLTSGLKHAGQDFENFFKGLHWPHLPNPSEIEQVAQHALQGAHNIGNELAKPAETAISIGIVLVAGVVAYEVYKVL